MTTTKTRKKKVPKVLNARISKHRLKFNKLLRGVTRTGYCELSKELIAEDRSKLKLPKTRRAKKLKDQVIFRKYLKDGYYIDIITSFVKNILKPRFADAGYINLVVGNIDGKKLYDIRFKRELDFIEKTILHATALNSLLFYNWPKDSKGEAMVIKRIKRRDGSRPVFWRSIDIPSETKDFWKPILGIMPPKMREHILHVQSDKQYYREVIRKEIKPEKTGSQVRVKAVRVKPFSNLRSLRKKAA